MKKNILKFNAFFIILLFLILMSGNNTFAYSSENTDNDAWDYSFECIDLNTRETEIVYTPQEIIDQVKEETDEEEVQPIEVENVDPRGEQIAPFAIIGRYDERKKVEDTSIFPYCAIAYIESYWPNGETTLGTAFMTSPKRALTAAHCLYDTTKGGYASSVTVWPGKDGFGLWNNPYGSTTVQASKLQVPNSYINANNANPNLEGKMTYDQIESDFGIIRFESNIVEKTRIFRFEML